MHVSSNRPVSEDEKADDVCSRRHLYCDTPVVTSWAVAGQQVVFLHMYLQTRVTLEAFPVATPRGRSSSSHEGERHLQITKIRVGDIFFSPPSTKGSSGYFRPLAYTANLDVWKKGSGAATRDPCLYGNSEKQRCARSSWNHLLCCTTWPDWEMIHLKVWIVLPQRKETPTLTRNPVSSKTKLKDHNLYQVAKSICKSSVDICDPGAHKQL